MSELVLTKNRGVFTFRTEDIMYMEKRGRKIRLRMRCNGCKCGMECGCCKECEGYYDVEVYGQFYDIRKYLDKRFMDCHRSYMINMDAIVWMCDREIYLASNESIHMGRDTYGRARKIFADYINEKYPEKTLKNANFFL